MTNSPELISPVQRTHLISAVKRAGEELLALWPGAGSQSQLLVTEKSDGTLVTQADYRSNKILSDAISELFPSDALLSEESPFNREALKKSERIWIIDPLDGTKSFVNGIDDFSVLVGLSVSMRPRYGVMLFPGRGLLVEGGDRLALVNGATITVSKADRLYPGRVYIRNCSINRGELASPMMDSGLALLKVANGELDGAIIRMLTHREWDIAAPIAVIRAAGGVVTDERGGEIPCGKGGVDFNYLVASNGSVHSELLRVI